MLGLAVPCGASVVKTPLVAAWHIGWQAAAS